ncbi:hypothetical protein CRYUN_Cryun04dG0193700 [Craigia yunnanensis]
MNLEEKVGMDLVPQSEHLCYVRCNFCNTVLAVRCKRLLDTFTVKCGHCSNLSFLSTRPPLQGQCLDLQTSLSLQAKQSFCGDFRKAPEKKHRLPSAYNRFMKEELQGIKTANPEISHREAFSAAAKNWARYIPNSLAASPVSGSSSNE